MIGLNDSILFVPSSNYRSHTLQAVGVFFGNSVRKACLLRRPDGRPVPGRSLLPLCAARRGRGGNHERPVSIGPGLPLPRGEGAQNLGKASQMRECLPRRRPSFDRSFAWKRVLSRLEELLRKTIFPCLALVFVAFCASAAFSPSRPAPGSWSDIVEQARWAQNAHNMQSWKLTPSPGDPKTLWIRLDSGRLLPQTDPPSRQLLISVGCFLAGGRG